MEPATGNRRPGRPGKAAIKATLGSGPWQPRQRNTRMCPLLWVRTPRHLTVAKESAVASNRKTLEARTVRTGTVLVTSVQHGELCRPLVRYGKVCENLRQVEVVMPRRSLSDRGKRSQGRLGSHTEAVSSATLPDRAHCPTQSREGQESHRVGNDASRR